MVSTLNEAQEVVWITGGGSGIGRALALEYGRRGATVAVSGRRLEPLEETCQQVVEAGGQAMALTCDVTRVTDLESTIAELLDEAGRLDIAIANAGFSVAAPFEELSAADWKRQLDVNVVGVAMTAKVALPALRDSEGRLALMGSVASVVALPDNGPYSASKFAVRGIGQTLTAELAHTGVSCTTLLPGFVESDIAKVDNKGRFRDDWEDRRPQKLMWEAPRAARSMVRAIDRRKSEAVITGHGKVVAFLGNHMPRITQHLAGRLGKDVRKTEED